VAPAPLVSGTSSDQRAAASARFFASR